VTDVPERRQGDHEMRDRLTRLEVTSEQTRSDVSGIATDMKEVSKQISKIAESHTIFATDIKGKLTGMKWAWAAIAALGAAIVKLNVFGTHT
jgi:hypothetical protein